MKTWTKKYLTLLAVCVLLLVNACTITEPTGTSAESAIEKALADGLKANNALSGSHKKNKALPLSLQKALMPDITIPTSNLSDIASDKQEPRFDIAVSNVPAKDFFMGLVKDTKYNITINSQVTGNISLELKSVTVPQTMDAIRDNYGFEYERTSYGYKIFPRRLETRVFQINYLDFDRGGQSQTTVGSGQITNTVQNTLTSSGVSSSQQSGSTPSGIVQTSSTSKFWDMLKENLTTLIGIAEGRSVVVNQKSGTIIVRAYPEELRYVAQYLDKVQNIIMRQVIIEAKILEVQLNANFQNGINWKILGLQQGEVSPAGATPNYSASNGNDGLEKFGGNIVSYLSLNASGKGGAFSSAISLLNTQGKVNVLSSPKIATINNQKAVIKVGNDDFFITNVSSNTSSSGSSNPTQQATVTFTPFFSGISLDVTPQIDENDYITMHIHPIISDVRSKQMTATVYNQSLDVPLASSETRESDSVVRAKNGQVIIIGGLMQSKARDINASTPGLDRLPTVGGLFKNRNKIATKTEIVILLRPILTGSAESWRQQLQEAATGFKNMKGTFSYDVASPKEKH